MLPKNQGDINKPPNVNFTLKAGSTVIRSADTYKYLGVWLTNDLNMTKHLNNGYKMAYQKFAKTVETKNSLVSL